MTNTELINQLATIQEDCMKRMIETCYISGLNPRECIRLVKMVSHASTAGIDMAYATLEGKLDEA